MTPAAVTAIKALLTASSPLSFIQWRGDAPNRPEPPAPWVFAELRGLNGSLLAIGGGPGTHQYQDDGFLSLHVFVPFGQSLDQAYVYIEQLAAIFRGQNVGGVQFLAASAPDAGPGSDDGNWQAVTTHIAFYFIFVG